MSPAGSFPVSSPSHHHAASFANPILISDETFVFTVLDQTPASLTWLILILTRVWPCRNGVSHMTFDVSGHPLTSTPGTPSSFGKGLSTLCNLKRRRVASRYPSPSPLTVNWGFPREPISQRRDLGPTRKSDLRSGLPTGPIGANWHRHPATSNFGAGLFISIIRAVSRVNQPPSPIWACSIGSCTGLCLCGGTSTRVSMSAAF